MKENNFKIKAYKTDGAFMDIEIPEDLNIFRKNLQKYI